LLALGFSPGATLAFVMAAGFIADTSSLPLIVSNLVNIVTADFFKLGFSEYASVMVPVNIASVAATLVMLHIFFRKDLPVTYDLAKLKVPREAIRDMRTFKTGWLVLLLLLAGFFALEPLGVPVSLVAAVAAQRRTDGLPLGHPESLCRTRPVECHARHRFSDGFSVIGDEQHAYCSGRGSLHRCQHGSGRD